MVSGRLERLTVNGDAMSARKVLIEDWCAQFPSHTVGSLAFGPEGALYVSGGDGASFTGLDYGQLGGTLPPGAPVTPVNPCGDPANEGGTLRSQDLRTTGDPTGLDGTILRVDPDTGDAWPDNARTGSENEQRIIAYGLRNPFRFTVRPDGHVWIGDVGWNTWEEINEIPDPDAAPRNFGWPCYEGTATQPAYQALGLPICAGFTQSPNAYRYNHGSDVVAGDGCANADGSSISGIAFRGTAGAYPNSYDNGLFFTDYTRGCIWFAPNAGGSPNFGAVARFADLRRTEAGEPDGGAVHLGFTPAGNLIYADLARNEVRQIVFDSANPPNASFTASPTSGTAPLDVDFDANGSSDPNGDTLAYAWDMDADGAYDDATGLTTSWTFDDAGSVVVKLRVTDEDGLSDTAQKTITVGNTAPEPSIDAPSASLTWSVGDDIAFAGSATDLQDGVLPASRFLWTLVMEHCPSSCHSHVITTIPNVTSGSFDAPNHDYPSHLRLDLKVTDSQGLSRTISRDLQPETGTVGVVSSPSGIGLTVGGTTGAPPAAKTGIVGSTIDVAAPATATLGETVYEFSGWSDGLARNHAVPVTNGDTQLTATYAPGSVTDASDSCSGAPIGPTGSTWRTGAFDSGSDADWYRFSVTSTRTVEIVLGDLPVDASLRLYKGCSTLLTSSDRSGTGTERILKSLAKGTYAVKVSAKGTASDPAYALRIRRLSSGLSVISSSNQVDEGAGTLTLVGEIWNEYSTTRGPITVTAKLYDGSGHLLGTRSAPATLYAVSHSRAPFRITGSLPDGFARATYSVTSPVSNKTVRNVSYALTSLAEEDGRWKATGTIKATSGDVRFVKLAMTLYDSRARVIDVVRAGVVKTTLKKNQSTTFTAWSTLEDLDVDLARVRTFGFKP